LRAKHRQHAIGNEQCRHFLGLRQASDARVPSVEEPDVLKHSAVLAIREVQERRRADARQVDPGRVVIERNELAGAGIG